MADLSPRRLTSPDALHSILEQYQATKSWDDFQDKFLDELVLALRQNSPVITLGVTEKQDFELPILLQQLSRYVTGDRDYTRLFPKILRTWAADKGVALDEADLDRTLKAIEQQPFNTNSQLALQKWREEVEALLQRRPAPAEEVDELRARLRELLDTRKQPFLELARLRSPLQDILGDFARGSTLRVSPELADALKKLPEERQPATKLAFQATQKDQQEKLNAALEGVFTQLWETPWGDDALAQSLFAALQRPLERSEEDLADYVVDALLSSQKFSPDPFTAVNQVEVYFGTFLPKLDQQLQQLRQSYDQLATSYQAALDKLLRDILSPPPAAPAEEAGGAEQPPEEAPPSKKADWAAEGLVKVRDILDQIGQLPDADTQGEALAALLRIAQEQGFAGADARIGFASELEGAIGTRLSEMVADPEETDESLRAKLNALIKGLSDAARPFLEPEQGLKLPVGLPPVLGALVTEVPGEVISEATARRSVSQLLAAQQTMVTQGLQELRLELRKKGFNDLQIDQILERNREMLSQQIWLEFLQRGGLKGELKFADMAAIWMEVVQKNLDRILIEQGKDRAALSPKVREELESALREAGYDSQKIEELFFDLKKDRFEQLVEFAQHAASLTADQRRAAITDILRGRDFAETDSGIIATLIANDDLGGLALRQLKQEPPILSLDDRRKLQVLLQKTTLGAADWAEFSRLMGLLVYVDFPPETFFHHGASEIAAVYELLARQQKATLLIGEHLGAFATTDRASQKAAEFIVKDDLVGLIEHQLKLQPPILSGIDRKKLQALVQKTGLSSEEQHEFARLIAILLDRHGSAVLSRLGAADFAALHSQLAAQPENRDRIAQHLAAAPHLVTFTNPFHNQKDGDLTVAKAGEVSEEEAATHVRDTLLLEVTLSLAFETHQEANLALVLHQFYANPQMTLAMLADGLDEPYGEDGQLLPAFAALPPEQQAQFAGLQRANYQAHAKRQAAAQAAQTAQQRRALAMAVIDSGGNPAMLAKRFLTDANARQALFAEIKRQLPAIIAVLAIPSLPALALALGALKILADLGAGLGNALSSIGSFFSGLFGGAAGSSATGLTGAAALGREIGANAATSGKVLASQTVPTATNAVGSTVSNTFATANTFLAGTSTAAVPGITVFASVFGPMAFAVIMTFTVFSVIAGSLNGLPAGAVSEGGFFGPKRNFCFEGNDRIVQAAVEISNGLEKRWWQYYNYHPNWPELFNFPLYNRYTPKTGISVDGNTEPDYFRVGSRSPNDMFWCTWLVVKAYQENNLPVPVILGVVGMKGAWPKTVNEVIENNGSILAQNIPLGSAVFIGTSGGGVTGNAGDGNDHVAIACRSELNSDGTGTFTTCDSNNSATQIDYNIRGGYVVRSQKGGVTIDYFGLPPRNLGGSCPAGVTSSAVGGGSGLTPTVE